MTSQTVTPADESSAEDGETGSPRRRHRRWVVAAIVVPLVAAIIPVAGATLTGTAHSFHQKVPRSASTTQTGKTKPPIASLTYPSAGSVITTWPTADPVRGEVRTAMPTSDTLWVVARAAGETNWHPFRQPCQVVRDEFVCASLYLGARDQRGVSFELELIQAGPAQTASLQAWANRPAADNTAFPLPDGSIVLQDVEITRG